MENNTAFGFRAIIKNGLTSSLFVKDILIPLLIAIGITAYHIFTGNNLLEHLRYVLDMSLSIIPSIVGLSLAAYTIVNAFVLGTQIKELKTKDGIEFLSKLNSSFAICLIISLSSLIMSVVCKLIEGCNIIIEASLADIINSITLILLITLLIYSIWCLFWIVIDIFNLGQTRAMFDNEE